MFHRANSFATQSRRDLRHLAIAVMLLTAVGCDTPVAEFSLSLPYYRNRNHEVSSTRDQEIANLLTATFGTPDEPFLLSGGEFSFRDILDPRNLDLASGPVGRDESGSPRGLYREHCVHCHGISGNGAGPTAAFLNPYPRDFRMGKFKFKSTPLGSKPTDDDLRRILLNGIPGTAMPSFHGTLTDPELDALIDYVKYLSIRGETERWLALLASDLDDDEEMDMSFETVMGEAIDPSVSGWAEAADQVVEIPAPPETDLAESIQRGRDFYYGLGGCAKCHGDTQLGDGQVTDYDDWAKDLHDWSEPIEAEERERLEAEYLSLGGLPLRNIRPRDLRKGIYRGGRRPIDLYWRIYNGIEGTPMPKAPGREEGSDAVGLTRNEVWDLVNYVRSLPYEPMSRPVADEPLNDRPPR